MVVTVRTLRRRMAEFALRVNRGESIVVYRHGHPWALLRQPFPDEDLAGRTQSITAFRRDLRRDLLRARRRPLRLTWRDEPLDVVVCAVPREFRSRVLEA
jgi:antitoxin (DNA-binding transcriptional repressor) of toxin-antitoxin stability system